MKKVFLSLAVLASVAMVSCNKKAASEGENADAANDSVAPATETVVAEETVVVENDSIANDSIAK